MDEEEKRRLLNEVKRLFQQEYNKLIEEIERLKKEFAPDDEQSINWLDYTLSLGDIAIVLRALEKWKSTLESFLEVMKPGSPGYFGVNPSDQTAHQVKNVGDS